MTKRALCADCGRPLTRDERALSRKLIDPDTRELYCLACMAENFGCTEEDLKIKIQEFKEQGCTLFL